MGLDTPTEVVVKLNYSMSDKIHLVTSVSSIKKRVSSHYPDISWETEDAFMQFET